MSRLERAEMPTVNGQNSRDVESFGNHHDDGVNKIDIRVVVFSKNLGGAFVIFGSWYFQNKICFAYFNQKNCQSLNAQIFRYKVGNFSNGGNRQIIGS